MEHPKPNLDIIGDLETAVPIWKILNISESEYYVKYPNIVHPLPAIVDSEKKED
jgi:hypothetical protein